MENSKNIYELLNEMTFNINDYEAEELTELEKKKFKDNYKKRTNKPFNVKRTGTIASALALTLCVFGLTSFGQNIYAATQSAISGITNSIGEALGIERNIERYSNVVNQVVENNGVEVKLMEVIIDKDELILSTIISASKAVDGMRFDYVDIFINGKNLNGYGMTGSSRKIDGTETMFGDTYAISVPGIDTKESLDIKIVFKDLNYYVLQASDIEHGEIKGKWVFEFIGNGSELGENTYALPLNYSFSIDGRNYILDEFRYNPVSQKIQGRLEGSSEDFYDLELRGSDNLGNEIKFYLSSTSKDDMLFRYQNLDKDFPDKITSMTLAPYAVKMPKESGRMSHDYNQVGGTFTIFLNE